MKTVSTRSMPRDSVSPSRLSQLVLRGALATTKIGRPNAHGPHGAVAVARNAVVSRAEIAF